MGSASLLEWTQKCGSSYRKGAVFIPSWGRQTDAVSIETGLRGPPECEQQHQNCCLHRVSENVPKQKLPDSQFNHKPENKEALHQFTRQEEPVWAACFWTAVPWGEDNRSQGLLEWISSLRIHLRVCAAGSQLWTLSSLKHKHKHKHKHRSKHNTAARCVQNETSSAMQQAGLGPVEDQSKQTCCCCSSDLLKQKKWKSFHTICNLPQHVFLKTSVLMCSWFKPVFFFISWFLFRNFFALSLTIIWVFFFLKKIDYRQYIKFFTLHIYIEIQTFHFENEWGLHPEASRQTEANKGTFLKKKRRNGLREDGRWSQK